jgi:hypothetical protein
MKINSVQMYIVERQKVFWSELPDKAQYRSVVFKEGK